MSVINKFGKYLTWRNTIVFAVSAIIDYANMYLKTIHVDMRQSILGYLERHIRVKHFHVPTFIITQQTLFL